MIKNYQLTWDLWPKKNPLVDYPSNTYFCFHTEWAGNRFKLINGDAAYSQGASAVNQPAISLEYSYDGETWTPLMLNTYVEFNNKVFLRGDNELWVRGGDIEQVGQTTGRPLVIPRFIVDKNFYVSGKLSSLVNKDMSTTGGTRLFALLFLDQPVLDAKYLQLNFENLYPNWNNDGYNIPVSGLIPYMNDHRVGTFTGMFYGCDKLENPPSLVSSQITSINYGCFAKMFCDCTNLKECMTINNIYSIGKFAEYFGMYIRCTSLTAAKALPDYDNVSNRPSEYAFGLMFYGCTNLTVMPDLVKYRSLQYETGWREGTFMQMFQNSGVKISDTQTDDYNWPVISVPDNEYNGPNATLKIFYGTQGPFTNSGELTRSATYYTNNPPVSQ